MQGIELVEGLLNGVGILQKKNGDYYKGEFVMSIFKEGIVKSRFYDGEMKNSTFHGFGTYKYFNSDKYEGYWENDKRYGRGKFTYNLGYVYDGEWINDKKTGQGVYTYPDGVKIDGLFNDDKL